MLTTIMGIIGYMLEFGWNGILAKKRQILYLDFRDPDVVTVTTIGGKTVLHFRREGKFDRWCRIINSFVLGAILGGILLVAFFDITPDFSLRLQSFDAISTVGLIFFGTVSLWQFRAAQWMYKNRNVQTRRN